MALLPMVEWSFFSLYIYIMAIYQRLLYIYQKRFFAPTSAESFPIHPPLLIISYLTLPYHCCVKSE